MNKIIAQLILILFYLNPFILTSYPVNQDGQNCNNADLEPTSESDCTSYNTENEACCFATILMPDRSTINRCIPVQKDARFALNYLTLFSFTDRGGVEHKDVTAKFECGQKEGLCGMDSPNKIFQCSEHSSTTRSCCYLTTPTYTECVLSSEKYDKETKFNLFDTSTVICSSDKMKIGKFNLIIYFALTMNLLLLL